MVSPAHAGIDRGITGVRAYLDGFPRPRGDRPYPDRYLPRSSCIGCPYKSDAEWKRLKEDNPKSFQDAVFIDTALREIPVVRNAIARKGEAYLHRSRTPLADVNFTESKHYDDVMLEECEGLCGI